MTFYGVGILPLSRKLKKGSDFLNQQKQILTLKEIVLWLKLLIAEEGPKYGYHPEPDKVTS